MDALISLNLDKNDLVGQIPSFTPLVPNGIVRMQELDMSSNRFTGGFSNTCMTCLRVQLQQYVIGE